MQDTPQTKPSPVGNELPAAQVPPSRTRDKPEILKFKICLLGDPSVGKTSLIQRYVYNIFSDEYLTTIGTKVTKKELEVPFRGERAITKLLIWDIMGQKEFRRLQSLYFQEARGAIVVCDLTRKETLTRISHWVSAFYEISPNVPLVIVANKHDLVDEAEFDEDQLMEVAEAFMAPYYLTSAKTGENVEIIFGALTQNIMKRIK